MSAALAALQSLRKASGPRQTVGLDDETVRRFLDLDPSLGEAIQAAWAARQEYEDSFGEAIRGDEKALVDLVQEDYINFYPENTVNPYVALAAKGPWLVTTHGAVVHDNGGYGMLGMGHAPDPVLQTLAAPQVMANVMTPNISQKRFSAALKRECAQGRTDEPFSHFICMNSGSEAVTVACRISDVNAARLTAPGARHAGKRVTMLSLKDSFHGRTDRPALVSDSSRGTYRKHLRSHAAVEPAWITPANDVAALEATFARADREGVFIEMMLMEPVMGEGNPGEAITREFYDAARRLTRAHGALLLVDSIQAGIRGTGFLSLVNYPGFEDCDPPDMEPWSKALNGGQYPMSVLGLGPAAAALYVRGIYGNTMTTNPKALEVGCTVLANLTEAKRQNIRDRGAEAVAGLEALKAEFPGVITNVQGTGLLFSCELIPSIEVVGFEGIETWLRKHGLGVIHGGENSIRFTPWFGITSEEVDLIVDLVRRGLAAFTGEGEGQVRASAK